MLNFRLIKFWDLRKSYSAFNRDPLPAQSLVYSGKSSKCGFSWMCLDDERQQLYASCMDNSIYQYSLTSTETYPYSFHTNPGKENQTQGSY